MADQHQPSPWLTAAEAAARAKVGVKQVSSSKQLRVARVGGRRAIRIHVDWVDAWLESIAEEVGWPPS